MIHAVLDSYAWRRDWIYRFTVNVYVKYLPPDMVFDASRWFKLSFGERQFKLAEKQRSC